MTWEVVGVICTALIGAVGYAIKKYVDWKVDKALAGQLDVLRKLHVERFDTVVRIKGMLAEIDHCMNHLKANDVDYSQRCKEWCMKVRQDARSKIALLGQDIITDITLLTDLALKYSDKPSMELYELWKTQVGKIYSDVDLNLRVLKATPTANKALDRSARSKFLIIL